MEPEARVVLRLTLLSGSPASCRTAWPSLHNQGEQEGRRQLVGHVRQAGQIEDRGIVYFCSTQGGAPDPAVPSVPGFGDGRGQVWAYDAWASVLRLVFESTGLTVLDLPDNVTASPRGSLVLCEDGLDNQNYLRGLTPDGMLFDFAKNAIAVREQEEFAGSTFAPDGLTLFVNIQTAEGLSFAVWGPWSVDGF